MNLQHSRLQFPASLLPASALSRSAANAVWYVHVLKIEIARGVNNTSGYLGVLNLMARMKCA